MLKLVEEDKLLKPFAGIIEKRHQQVLAMEREFTYRTTRLSDKCNSYLYYGLHRTNEGWVFREWAPNATAILSFIAFFLSLHIISVCECLKRVHVSRAASG